MAKFPDIRLRRLRSSDGLRRLTRETSLSVDNLIYPLFVAEGNNLRYEIDSMPGIYCMTPDLLPVEIEELNKLGIKAVLLFGIPVSKDEAGTGAYDGSGVIEHAIETIKATCPDITVITDICLCEYTTHGHCGVIKNNLIDNDSTLPLLARMAVSHANAGADMVAPSDMMDGRVAAIRHSLDENGFPGLPIMAYSAKFASAFYGPFRDAVKSSPSFGNRSSYQMAPTNPREALREIEQDIIEGADIVMVKPALAYLDIINRASSLFNVPIAAYNVSGEYSMVKMAAKNNLVNERELIPEILMSIKRAGAGIIITYHAKEFASWQSNGGI